MRWRYCSLGSWLLVVNLGWQGWDKDDENGRHDTNGNNKENRETKKQIQEADEILETSEIHDIRETQILPSVKKGETGVAQVFLTKKTIKPPKPYAYHSLLAAMNNIHLYVKNTEIRTKLKEVQGTGTEATQEGILSTLFNRGYLLKKKKQVLSTEIGKILIGMLLHWSIRHLVKHLEPDVVYRDIY